MSYCFSNNLCTGLETKHPGMDDILIKINHHYRYTTCKNQ